MPRWPIENKNPLGKIRTDAGYSREQAAATMNISLSTMLRYETGVTDIPIGIAEAMAILYKVPFEILRNTIKEMKKEKGIKPFGYVNATHKKEKESIKVNKND